MSFKSLIQKGFSGMLYLFFVCYVLLIWNFSWMKLVWIKGFIPGWDLLIWQESIIFVPKFSVHLIIGRYAGQVKANCQYLVFLTGIFYRWAWLANQQILLFIHRRSKFFSADFVGFICRFESEISSLQTKMTPLRVCFQNSF